MSPIPAQSPFQVGDHVQALTRPPARPSSPPQPYRGTVEGYLGATVLHGTTDDGKPWAEFWDVLRRAGGGL